MFKIALSKLNELFSLISEEQSVFAPIEKAGQVEFYPWEENSNVRLDVLNTVKSSKDFFFPQSENLVKFKVEGKNISITPEELMARPSVYFGVRACDVKSFDILDKVFLSEPVDSYYADKRKNGTIIALACNKPEKTCFCSLFGVDASNPAGDVVTWIINDELYWESVTEKGNALTEKVKSLLTETDSLAVDTKKVEIKEIIDNLPLKDLSLEGFNGDALMEKFNDPQWAELSRACLGCGTCTFVCPTCQCYDIRDFDTGNGVQRYRCWDSCMYSDFTKMAHGNNRNSQVERFRQRFMHKLIYFPAKNDGEYSCVGCGRCMQKCPISMNIVKVIKALGGNNNE